MGNVITQTRTQDQGTDRPTPAQTIAALMRVADLLGQDICWLYEGAFHFRLPADGLTIALTPESASRFRLESCALTVPRSTVWVIEGDDARLAASILAFEAQANLV